MRRRMPGKDLPMTRTECEAIVTECLKTIRDAVRAHNPEIEQVCIGIAKNYAWAFSLKEGEGFDYLLNVNTNYGLNPEEESDESDS